VPASETSVPPPILWLSDASGREFFHTFKVDISKDAAPTKPIVVLPHPEVVKKPSTVPAPTSSQSTASLAPVAVAPAATMIVVVPAGTSSHPASAAANGAASARDTIALPGMVDDLCAGGDGKYLVAFIKSARQVVVIDVIQRRIAKYIQVDDEQTLVAAGRTKFVIYQRKLATLSRYALATGERELVVSAGDFIVARVLMGACSEGPVVLVPREYGTGDRRILDLATLKPTLRRQPAEPDLYDRAITASTRISSDGATIFASGRAFSIVALDSGIRSNERSGDIWGIPTADGRFLCAGDHFFSRSGQLLGAEHEARASGSAVLIPAVSGSLVLKVPYSYDRDPVKPIELLAQGRTVPISEFSDISAPKGFGPPITHRGRALSIAQQVFFIPVLNTIAMLSSNKDGIELRKFEWNQVLAKTTRDDPIVVSAAPLVATLGSEYTYRIEAKTKDGVPTYRLDAGPSGMTVSADGLVRWQVPQRPTKDKEQVTIFVVDASGRGTPHVFQVLLSAPLITP
jgi:hypothetical protein